MALLELQGVAKHFGAIEALKGVDLSIEPGGALAPLLGTAIANDNAVISPDGRWIAYEARESANREVFVRPFPDVESGRWQISSGGGMWPVWSRDGRELFFSTVGPDSMLMAVDVTPAAPASFDWGVPKPLFSASPYIRSTARGYDVAADGRFIAVADPTAVGRTRASILFVSHWFDELNARAK